MSGNRMKAVSFKESLRKTVLMLSGEGVTVQFRGFQPRVEIRNGKVIRMVLPEVGDDPSEILIQAMHGFLDHEVGHMLITPFDRATKFARGHRHAGSLANIVEDIRLEKIVPRTLPGMKHNLERMYQFFIPELIAPDTAEMVATGNPSKQFFGVLVPAMRALAGQKDFQKFMDDMNYWIHFKPLLKSMPHLSRRLREMETYQDVESITTDIIAAIEAMMPKEEIEPPQQTPDSPQEGDEDDEPDTSPQPGEDGQEEPEDGDEGEPSGDGKGHGDGSGEDDEKGDEDDTSCSGDDSDEDGDDESDGSGDGAGNEPRDKDDTKESESSGKHGKTDISITDALKQLEPTQRRAMFMYKKRKQSVSQIAEQTMHTEEQVKDLLVAARRRLKEIMNGG